MTPPEILTGLFTDRMLILNQRLFKEHAGFKGVVCQHALTKTVDGKNGGFIHLPFSQQQALSSTLFILNQRQKRTEPVILPWFPAFFMTQTGDPQLMDVLTDTPPQFIGCRFGKGHHQDLFRR